MNPSWIEYKGKSILYFDYRRVKDTLESLRILRKGFELIIRSDGNVLILQNFEGAVANDEYMAEVKTLGKTARDKVKKNACVGITGIKRLLLQAYVAFSGEKTLRTFETEEGAKEWLVQE
ncbi:MAG: hypothetical protein JXD23_00435 [Spirochaetales bacterium]|nr:hypothetical protein [Spirochaetales bacterium]